ncbi:MAG: hypothetical protein J1F35_06460 [Erysipelotrichales bacterium]|nr:hypothetical protein [Erysipelotrichales bacterium]
MKSLTQFIVEANHKFPILIGEYNDDMDDAEFEFEDMKDEFFRIFDDSGAKSIVMYKSESRKHMDGLYYEDVFEDAEEAWEYLIDKTWHGFRMYVEDDYIVSVAHIISGPQQSPSEYFYFSELTKNEIMDLIEEEDGEAEADKTYIKISNLI